MKLKKGILVVGFLLIVFLVLYTFLSRKRSPVIKYNVVLIVADALRKDVLSCYGGEVHTPNINWLAENGALFENAYSAAPFTGASSLGMFTGNYSSVYELPQSGKSEIPQKIRAFHVADEDTLLAEELKEIGYEVRMDVENIVVMATNCLQGFKICRDVTEMEKKELAFLEQKLGIQPATPERNFWIELGKNYFPDFLHFILTVSEGQSFFLVKWFLDPHFPYSPPEKYLKKDTFDPSKMNHPLEHYVRMKEWDKKNLSAYEKFVVLRELYLAEVAYLDERVGYIIRALEQRNLLDQTYIIFTSDHGELFGEHGRTGHTGSLLEPVLNVPLIIKGPGISRGERIKTELSHVDLVPTLKEMLDMKYESDTMGSSYASLFHGLKLQDRPVYFDNASFRIGESNRKIALLMNGFKLVLNRDNMDSDVILYNVRDDPSENENLSQLHPDIVDAMTEKILELMDSCALRREKNLSALGEGMDVSVLKKDLVKKLRSLGYIK